MRDNKKIMERRTCTGLIQELKPAAECIFGVMAWAEIFIKDI